MSDLKLQLFGPPRLERAGTPLGLERRKAEGLLAYLVVTRQRHSREALATLLWPDCNAVRGRANLSRALAVLKGALGPGCLAADRETVKLDAQPNPATSPETGLWVDVTQFQQRLAACATHGHPTTMVCAACLPPLSEAAALYTADFLAGFTLPGSTEWDSWQFFQTDELRRELCSALERLGRGYRGQGQPETAIVYVRRWVGLEPLNEAAHRQLMTLYASVGQRAAALAQYKTCRRVLEADLGAEPAEETRSLFEEILTGALRVSTPTPERSPGVLPQQPAFLKGKGDRAAAGPYAVFVARERELAQLDQHLADALGGQGRTAFVTGEAGCGKTALLAEFTRRAIEAHAEVIVASGSCSAYSGIGDPYLPFRDVMGMLTGDVEAKWAAGLISREHAHRLWQILPEAVQVLVDRAPGLIDTFGWRKELLSRATVATPGGADWLEELRKLTSHEQAGPADLSQSQLMGQCADVLHSLAAARPLLITVDDLQWADVASIELLFHLARNLAGRRVLLVGAYRSEEVALGRDGGRHPLQKGLSEFKRTFGDIWIDLSALGESEGRRFVDALLDTEPNRLGEGFRQRLLWQTGGHPLFTVELLRGMQERGNLVRHQDRKWIERSSLDWRTLPARVEGVIEERIGRLEPALREILSVASVEGERFTAQVVARVRRLGTRQVLQNLSHLERRHRLVLERPAVRVDGQFLARYEFSHILFQRYLYGDLNAAERRRLHGEIAQNLEDLHVGRTGDISVQLAGHYAEAEEREKAVEYLLRAGDQARGLYAYQEAITFYQRALEFLKAQREYERAARTLMKLGLTYHLALDFRRTRKAYEEGFALWQRAGQIRVGAPLPPAPHALRVGLGVPTILDPAMPTDTFSIAIIDQLCSGLAERTPAMNILPDVAQSWEVSEGGRKYILHLREDMLWSDGKPLTAGDFEYAWKRALAPTTKAPVAGLMDDVKGATAFHQGHSSDPDRVCVRALDDVTLEVELEGPTAYFPHLLALHKSFAVPRHVVEAHGEAWTDVENIVTNGPFRLEAWKPEQSAVLVCNPAYHGRFTGNVQSVEVSLLADPGARLELYEADGLDIFHLCDLPAAALDRARHRNAGEYISVPMLCTHYVGFDTSRSPFSDPRVRRAFVLATDRDSMVDTVWRDIAFPATGGFVPPGMLGHSAGIAMPYDPDQARQLLAEAGYPGGRGFPMVNFPTDPRRVLHGEYLQAHWRENLGVEIALETLDWRALSERLDKEPPHVFCIGETADNPDPDDFLRVRASFLTRWQNQTYGRLVEEARRVMDQGERMEMYQAADRILVEEASIMPFAYGRCHLLLKPWIRRCPTSATKFWFWKDVIIDPH